MAQPLEEYDERFCKRCDDYTEHHNPDGDSILCKVCEETYAYVDYRDPVGYVWIRPGEEDL